MSFLFCLHFFVVGQRLKTIFVCCESLCLFVRRCCCEQQYSDISRQRLHTRWYDMSRMKVRWFWAIRNEWAAQGTFLRPRDILELSSISHQPFCHGASFILSTLHCCISCWATAFEQQLDVPTPCAFHYFFELFVLSAQRLSLSHAVWCTICMWIFSWRCFWLPHCSRQQEYLNAVRYLRVVSLSFVRGGCCLYEDGFDCCAGGVDAS